MINKFDQDKTRPVLFSESFGGSESQVRLLFKHVPDKNTEKGRFSKQPMKIKYPRIP